MEKVVFFNDEGKEESFYILADTVLNEVTYILASDTNPDLDEESECFILKLISEMGDDSIYEPVEDENEYTSVLKIFEELMEVEFEQ